MTPLEHYKEAEKLIQIARERAADESLTIDQSMQVVNLALAEAQVHATLATCWIGLPQKYKPGART